MDAEPKRHDFVHLAGGWRDHPRTVLTPACAGEIGAWVAARPLVVARVQDGDEPGDVRLGLALPDKRRLGLRVHRDVLAALMPAPDLADAMAAAPPGWRTAIETVRAIGRTYPARLRVYGSLAWQALTGLAYVRAGSDLDLLVECTGWEDLLACAAALDAASGDPRLDGEAILPGGAAVAWREIAARPGRVMVKALTGIRLAETASLPGLFA